MVGIWVQKWVYFLNVLKLIIYTMSTMSLDVAENQMHLVME